jgi:hypothetical protein
MRYVSAQRWLSTAAPISFFSVDNARVSAWRPDCNPVHRQCAHSDLNAFDVARGDLNTFCEAKIVSDSFMKSQIVRMGFVVFLAGASLLSIQPTLSAKDPVYARAMLLSMDSQSCGTTENGSKTVAGEILGTGSEKKSTLQVLCQDYVLQSDRIVYHIRPKDAKHPVLLPVGDAVQFRIEKNSLFLRDAENTKKEYEYVVISMEQRPDVKDVRDTAQQGQ